MSKEMRWLSFRPISGTRASLTLGLAACLVAAMPFISGSRAFAATPVPLDSRPAAPGVFGIGFTNVTDTSARLVFTSSEPMSISVEVFDHQTSVQRLAQPSFDEIHAVAISSLSPGKEYRVVISGTGKAGATASGEAILKPALRPASAHRWPGYTIFSSTTNDNPDAIDLLTQSGARMVRIEPSWDGLFPRKGELNHAFLDRWVTRVAELKKHNIEPLVILDYSVAWGMPYTHTTMTWRNKNFGPPDQLADWEEYVRTVVKALHGAARYYEVWNEPDAGYLATGSFVERPDIPTPIGRPPFKDNTQYWIGDRYVPLIETVRKVMNELEPNAVVMNGGWNRDYAGTRGDIMFERGAAPYLDAYAYHVYAHSPTSFSRWYKEVDGGFRVNIDRIFDKHKIQLPLAVTEWGTPAYSTVPEGKGFASFEDSRLFYLKSTFYFLNMERFELLSQFDMGVGSSSRAKDPDFFMLVNEDAPGKPIITPTYRTFQWLAKTFGSKPYRALKVTVPDAPQIKAYAIQLKDSREVYLAAWQDGPTDDNGLITPLPARTIDASIAGLAPGKYQIAVLDLDGKTQSQKQVQATASLSVQVPLPAATTTSESQVFLVRMAPGK